VPSLDRRPQLARTLAPADLAGEVRLDECEVPRVGHPDAAVLGGMTVNCRAGPRMDRRAGRRRPRATAPRRPHWPHSPTSWHPRRRRAWRRRSPTGHRHEHVAVEGGRLEAVACGEGPRPEATTLRRSSIDTSVPWSLSAHTPRVTGLSPMTALRSRKPTRALSAGWLRSRWARRLRRRAHRCHRRSPRRMPRRLAGARRRPARHRRSRSRQLLREMDLDRRGPGSFHVVADGRSGGGPEDQNQRAEARGQRVTGEQVEHGLAAGPTGASGLTPPKRRARPAASTTRTGSERSPLIRPSGARRSPRSCRRRNRRATGCRPASPARCRWRRRAREGSRPTRCCHSGR